MKKAIRKFLAVALSFAMLPSILAPAMAANTSLTAARDTRITEAALEEQTWQLTRAFPNGTDDTLAINSLGSWNGYRDQGELYVTLDEQVESLRLFVNNVEIDTSAMKGGKTYKIDIADLSVDGINTVQVSNIAPVGVAKIVTVHVGYPVVLDGSAEDVGMNPDTLDTISDFINSSVKYGFSGAQLAIVKDGKLVMSEGYGNVNGWNADGTPISEEAAVPVTTETLYDLASNTKMYSVNYAIQYLYEQGKLDIEDKIVKYFDNFAEDTIWVDFSAKNEECAKTLDEIKQWKSELTIKDIMMHQAGFPADPQYYDDHFDQATMTLTEEAGANVLYAQGREDSEKMILATPLYYQPGTKTVYSDVDYMLLGMLVEKIVGTDLDTYLKETFWEPMGLEHITYNPLEHGFTKDQIAATELDGDTRSDFADMAEGKDGPVNFANMRTDVIQGEVHDGKAYHNMDGIAGHAGMFANAEDLAKLCSVMLTGGYGDNHYFTSSTMEQFIEAKSESANGWGLGWWREGELQRHSYWTSQSSNETIGHQGWTGTLTMIDPEEDLVVVLLTNKKNSPVLDNEESLTDFYSDNMLLGSLGSVMSMVYDAIRSSDEAVDAELHQLALERIRLLSAHTDAYDENVHVADSFAAAELMVLRAEKRLTTRSIDYAGDVLKVLREEVEQYVTGGYQDGTHVANQNNPANAQKWLAELEERVAALSGKESNAGTVMTAVKTDSAPGINSDTLEYESGADQNAVYFPRVMSGTGRATGYCYRNYTTWFEGFKGQGVIYLSVYKPVSSMRLFINGNEVDTSAMLNTTGIFKVDCAKYTRNGRNHVVLTDVGYNAERSILMVIPNPEVVEGTAAEVGMNEAVFDMIDKIVRSDVAYGFPSAQLAVVKNGKLVHTNAWGLLNSYEQDGTHVENGTAVTDETLYDLASNTKMYSVNYAMQLLVSQGKVSVDDKITKYFPSFVEDTIWVDFTEKYDYSATTLEQVKEWKSELTVRELLEHQAGFLPDPKYYSSYYKQGMGTGTEAGVNVLFAQGREDSEKMVLATPLYYQPGTQTVYSDVDYMLLGMIVEKVAGTDLNTFLKENFWDPMGLTNITFNPLDNGFTKEQVAATELNGDTRDGNVTFDNNRTETLQGLVHDGKAYHNFDGVAGHAGLFASATDLAKLAQVMQNYNGYGETRLSNHEINTYFTGRKDSAANWGLGWWRQGNSQRPWYFGQQAPSTTIGHQGWTGTLTAIDTENNLTTVYLTNKINSAITDDANPDKFDGNWYTASSLGFVPTILYLGMEEFSATEDIQPALDALMIDMAVIKMNRVVKNGTTDVTHPNLVSAYAVMKAAVETVVARPTQKNLDSLRIAFASMARKFTAEQLSELYDMVETVLPFTDLNSDTYYYGSAVWAYLNNMIDGTGETSFAPDAQLTYADVVTTLWRAAGMPNAAAENSAESAKAVRWALENGIIDSAERAASDAAVTRGEVLTLLWRAAGKPSVLDFTDVSVGEDCYSAVLWAVDEGITNGLAANRFGTDSPCTRAQLVTMLYRYQG